VTHGSLQRGARFLVQTGALLALSALPLVAQDPPDPFAKLEPNCRFTIELLMDSANVAGLPSNALRLTTLQGISKRVDCKRIVDAVRKQLGHLRSAKEVLGGVDDQELEAAASVLNVGAKPAQLAAFRARKRGRSDLAAFIVWADFLQRSVPNEEAYTAITKLWQDGADDDTFKSLWTNVQSDISQGLNPGTALQNRIREAPGRASPSTVKPPEGQQENQSSR
jgi:hypothetical protein